MKSIATYLFLLVCTVSPGVAQDRVFNYIYQSTVLRGGEREVEVWNALRWGREEYYRQLEHRLEFETGVSRNLQTAFYLNVVTSSEFKSQMDATTRLTLGTLTNETEVTFSNEWKLSLSDPVADPLGVALYAEYTLGSTQIGLEPKLILDKAFGRSLVALNVVAEFEAERVMDMNGALTTRDETMFEVSAGFSQQLSEGIAVGIEAMSRSPLEEGNFRYTALFAGPTVSVAGDKFWINLTIMPQLPALRGATSGGFVLDEEQRMEVRLLLSYAL